MVREERIRNLVQPWSFEPLAAMTLHVEVEDLEPFSHTHTQLPFDTKLLRK